MPERTTEKVQKFVQKKYRKVQKGEKDFQWEPCSSSLIYTKQLSF